MPDTTRTKLVPLARLAFILVLTKANPALGATSVWTGAAAPNTNWSNLSNWSDLTIPVSGNDLVFPGTAKNIEVNFDDLPATVSFNSIRFTGATAYDVFSANELKLTSGITVSNSIIGPAVVATVHLLADQTFAAPSLFLSSIVLDGHQLTFDTSGGIALGAIFNGTNVPGVINGAGTIRKRGTGVLNLYSANTYTGLTIVEEGALTLDLKGTLGSAAKGTIVSNGATLNIFNRLTTSEPLELSGRLTFGPATNAVWSGPITLTSANATFDIQQSSGLLRVSGVISGGGSLTKTNAGALVLEADDSYSGETLVQAGMLIISNSHLAGAVTLSSNAIFAASGQIGPLSATGAKVSAGSLTSPGLLQVNGPLTLDSATQFAVDINGTTPGTSYDQVRVTGPVDLAGAQLVLQTAAVPGLGTAYVIVRKDSPGPVTGTFAGLDQFATFTRGAFVWQIDYFGIDGNDVVLRVISQTVPGVIWDGGGSDANWLTAANWLSDAVPSPEADLVFSTEATQLANFNNFPAGTRFNRLHFTGPRRTSGIGSTISGNPLALLSGVEADAASGSSTINCDLSLAGATIDSRDGLRFYGAVTNFGSPLALRGTGSIIFAGPISGAFDLTSSAGFVRLLTNNLFIGSTLISTGTVRVEADGAFGVATNIVTVESGASLQLDRTASLANPLMLRGILNAWETNGCLAPITAEGTNAVLRAFESGQLTIFGPISGSGEMTLASSGSSGFMALNGVDTYSGLTHLASGLLVINGSHAGGALNVGTNAPFRPTILSGTGTVGSVFAAGTIAPGLTTNAGALSVAGSLTLSNTAVLDIQIYGTNVGINYDQLRVSGAVVLDNPALKLAFGDFAPPPDTTFTIIRNDSGSTLSGAFAGLPEFAFFTNGPVIGRITYRGGDGNDVVLSIGTNLPSIVIPNPCTALPLGAVAWWRGEGNSFDSAGTNTGNLQDGGTFAPGKVGQAFSFDGSNAVMYTELGMAPAVTNDFTMELWVYPTAGRGSTPEISSGGTGINTGQRYAIFPRHGDSFGGGVHAGAGISIGTNGVSVFEHAFFYIPSLLVYDGPITGWTHVAVVYTNNRPSLFVNGTLVRTGLQSDRVVHPGSDMGGVYGFFAGMIDEYTIYNRALSGAEIQAVYAAGSAGKCLMSCVARPEGLVSWYRGEGDANDFTSTNHGALQGPVMLTNGIAGQAFLFNGDSGGVNLGNVPAFDFAPDSNFSIEAWFNSLGPSGGGNDGQIIVALNYNCGHPLDTLQSIVLANVGTNAGKVLFQIRDANELSDFVLSPLPVTTNQFHHVVGVREVNGLAKTLRLYLDGVLVDSKPDPTTGALAINVPDWIGRRNSCGTDNVFNGIIDEVSIYDGALTDAEVAALFNAGGAGKCTSSTNTLSFDVTVLLRDSNGAPIAAGLVTLDNQVSGRLVDFTDGSSNTLLFGEITPPLQGFTDAQGSFTFTNVSPSSSLRLVPRKPGFAFQPASSNLPPLSASQTVAFVGSNISRTVSGRITFSDGTPAPNIQVSILTPTVLGDGSVRFVGPGDVTDFDGRYSHTGLTPVASCYVAPVAAGRAFSPASQTVSLVDGDATADFEIVQKTWRISGQISPAAGVSLGADVTMLVAIADTGAGTNVANVPTIISAASRLGAYTSPPLPEGRSYLVQPIGVGLNFTPARRPVSSLAANVNNVNFTFVPAQVNITGRVTNSSGFGLTAPHVIISGGINATQQVGLDGTYAFNDVPFGQTYILSASHTNFLFNPASALLSNLSLSRTQNFAGGPALPLTGRIAFVRNNDVIVMNADSSLPVTVPKVFADSVPSGPALSPDGTKVAYVAISRVHLGNKYPLIVQDVDGSNVRLLTGLDEVAIGSSWSPDGTRVATVIQASASRPAGIYLLSIDGGTAFRLPNSQGNERNPAWSPDGTTIAFDATIHTGRRGSRPQIFTTGTNEVSPPQAQASGGQPAWSPDSTRIAYVSPIGRTSTVRVGSFPGFATNSYDLVAGGLSPAWSPDGEFLSFSDVRSLLAQPGRIQVVNTNQTFETSLADGQFASWSRAPGLITTPGVDVTVSNGVAAVSFSTISALGTTTITPTPPPANDTLPAGYVAIDGASTLMNFEITTTAEHSGPITLCFTLTNITNSVIFDSLRILHNENGLLVDRTLLPPDPQAPNFAAKTLCARVDSLSPFALAQLVDSSMPLLTGLVVDVEGKPVGGVVLSLTGDGTLPTRTDTSGRFTFPNLRSGETYGVVPANSRYDFIPPVAILENVTGTNLLAFTAIPKTGPVLGIRADVQSPEKITLAWPASATDYILEFTDSLSDPAWTPVDAQPFAQDGYLTVTLQADSTPLFFRLQQ